MSTTLLRTRIDTRRIHEASEILEAIGLTPGDAVNMFFAQVVQHRGIPFPVLTSREPNAETIAAMREVDDAIKTGRGPRYATAREAMAALKSKK